MATGIADIKKGDTVVLMGFTGIRLANVVVESADKKQIVVNNVSKGTTMTFDRKTGVQTGLEEGKERYANKIVHPDDAPVQKKAKAEPQEVPAKKAAPAKEEPKKGAAPAKAPAKQEAPAKAPAKAAPAAKGGKPAPKAPAKPAEEEEDDGYEEV